VTQAEEGAAPYLARQVACQSSSLARPPPPPQNGHKPQKQRTKRSNFAVRHQKVTCDKPLKWSHVTELGGGGAVCSFIHSCRRPPPSSSSSWRDDATTSTRRRKAAAIARQAPCYRVSSHSPPPAASCPPLAAAALTPPGNKYQHQTPAFPPASHPFSVLPFCPPLMHHWGKPLRRAASPAKPPCLR